MRITDSRSRVTRLASVIAVLWLIQAAFATASAAQMSRIVAAEGRGYLEQVGDQLILHVAGTPYQMGWQHGRLLREHIRESTPHALGGIDPWARYWRRLSRTFRRQAPQAAIEEAYGVADGAGVSRDAVAALQLVSTTQLLKELGLGEFFDPPRLEFGFSATAWGAASADGKLYQASGSPGPGLGGPELAEPPVLVVARPAKGLACVYATFGGHVGCLSGMNASGVSVSAQVIGPEERSRPGTLSRLLVTDLLRRASTRDRALRYLRRQSISHRYCLTVSAPDGAIVVEGTPSRVETLLPTDEATNTLPHSAIPGVLRRSGHFVHPATAATQRRAYHPAYDMPHSWLRYWTLSHSLVRDHGRIDRRRMLRIGLDPAVREQWEWLTMYCPSELTLWFLQPQSVLSGEVRNPVRVPRLSLPDLLADRRVQVASEEVRRPPDAEAGICECEDTLRPLSDADPDVNGLLQRYDFPPAPFPWRLRYVESGDQCNIYHVTFPSPQRFDLMASNTIHAEYYMPHGLVPQGSLAHLGRVKQMPGLIVLHILDGRFLVARMVCREFAKMQIPCLMVQMPYYGDRRPRGVGLAEVMLEKPERMFEAMERAVPDIRRAACWLQARPEVDRDRLGLLGVSLGAITGALVAGVDPRFNRNVLVIGGGDPASILWHAPETRSVRRQLEKMGYSRDSLAEAIQAVDPVTFAHRVNPRQVLMINATADKTIPKRCTLALWEAMGKPTLQWRRGGHYSMGLYTPLILSDAHTFITRLPADASWREQER